MTTAEQPFCATGGGPQVSLGAPFCPVNVGPLVCPSRAAPQLLPTARSSPTAALAPQPLPLAALSFGARPVRPTPPLRPSLAPLLLTPSASAARLASRGRPSGAAGTRRRKRAKHRRRTRLNSKRSLWREIERQDFACLAMRACCADSSSDDEHDTHNTDNDALLLDGHPIMAPVLLSRLSALDELFLALAGSPWTFSP